jgi:thiamine biosynthesis lipoprotein
MNKLISEDRIFMNTKVEFNTWTAINSSEVHKIFDMGFTQFHFVIERFSRFNPESELSILNKSSGKGKKITKELFELIEFALNISKKTNGSFDPTIIDFLETYGYDANYNFSRLSNKGVIEKEISGILKTRPKYSEIKLNPKNLTIQLKKRQRIDLGGIGKGYAIDLAFKKLLPLENFLINAGGDIKAKGHFKDTKYWPVGLKVPSLGQIGIVKLNNEAVCCSGSWARKVKFFHHLINPKTGKPQNELKATFVISKEAKEADAWSTALFASGENAIKLIKKYKLKAILVDKNNKIKCFNIKLYS